MGHTPNYSHLVGIMISKTIGCRGLANIFRQTHTCNLVKTVKTLQTWCQSKNFFQCDQNNFKLQLRGTLLENGLTLTWHGCAQSSSGAQSVFFFGAKKYKKVTSQRSDHKWRLVGILWYDYLKSGLQMVAVFWFGNWMFTNPACQYSQGFSYRTRYSRSHVRHQLNPEAFCTTPLGLFWSFSIVFHRFP